VWLRVEKDGIEGGEASSFSLGNHRQSTENNNSDALQQLALGTRSVRSALRRLNWCQGEAHLPSLQYGGVDEGHIDWLGKRVGLPPVASGGG